MKNLIATLGLVIWIAGVAGAAELRAPSDLKVRVLGANSFFLQWKDNAADETGFHVLASIGAGSTPAHFSYLSGADLNSYLMVTNEIPGRLLRLQVRAYRGEGADRVYSDPSSIVEVTAMEKAVFTTPQNLRATALDDARIRLRWDDPSTTEAGYFIEMRKGTGEWKFMGSTGIEKSYNIVLQQLEPASSYTYRVRAFKGVGAVVTGYSNEASAKTPPFQAPGMLVAKNEGEGLISLKWKDLSSLEEGFEIQSKEEGGKFKKLGDTLANQTSTQPIELNVATPYEFRVRSFRTVEGKKVYSKFSNVAVKSSMGLARPTNLVVSATTENSVTLGWTDASKRETGYTVRYKEKGKRNAKVFNLPAGTTTYTASDLLVARVYEFQVRAFDGETVSRYTDPVEGLTRDQLLGSYDVALTSGVSFVFDVKATRPDQIEKVEVSGLPPGAKLDAETRSISGVVATAGLYEAVVRVTFKAGYTVEKTLVLRVQSQEGGPVVVQEFATLKVAKGASKDVGVNGKFRDSDVSVARRFATDLGSFDVVLFETTTPKTVQNFLKYADGGRYKNTFFHRAPEGFVVQGGGFTYNGSSMGKVNTFAPVQNEPGISNLRGTVAMAKLGGDPDSATSQFFINLSDANAPNLDVQNGGFTVFGRIAGKGMDLFDEIDAMPKGNYTIAPGGVVTSLDDVPVNTGFPAPATLDPNDLVRVTSVGVAPILTYKATSLSPAVATVAITGGTLRVTGGQSGTARIRVRATDLDGLFADQIFDVTVP